MFCLVRGKRNNLDLRITKKNLSLQLELLLLGTFRKPRRRRKQENRSNDLEKSKPMCISKPSSVEHQLRTGTSFQSRFYFELHTIFTCLAERRSRTATKSKYIKQLAKFYEIKSLNIKKFSGKVKRFIRVGNIYTFIGVTVGFSPYSSSRPLGSVL